MICFALPLLRPPFLTLFFLANSLDPDTNPVTIQEVSDYVLSLRLPADTAAILRKMAEIRSLAAKLQCPESILAQTAENIARAKRLQQEAEQAR